MMKSKFVIFTSTLAMFASSIAPAGAATTLSVPGISDPFLAGMPSLSLCCGEDSAPAESPVFAGAVIGGQTITFTNVTGSVSYSGGTPTDPPVGNVGDIVNTLSSEGMSVINGIAGYTNAPVDALIGVFLGPGLPTATPASVALDFSAGTLDPGLQQIFYIGDGFGYGKTSGTTLGFVAPAGATRLYLATVDGVSWYNNTGAIDVTVNGVSAVPEPATWALFLIGVGALGVAIFPARKTKAGAHAAAFSALFPRTHRSLV